MGHVFISYKSEQRVWACCVRDALQSWGFTTWMDSDNLENTEQWMTEIYNALEAADALVAIVTPEALESRYVTSEWDISLVHGIPFIPVELKSVKMPQKYAGTSRIQAMGLSNLSPSSLDDLRDTLLEVTNSRREAHRHAHYHYLVDLYKRMSQRISRKTITTLATYGRDGQRTAELIPLKAEIRDCKDGSEVLNNIDDSLILSVNQKGGDRSRNSVLLLGEPGGGKTMTLLNHARNLVVACMQNPVAAIPIVASVDTWNPQIPSIYEWLHSLKTTPANSAAIIRSGAAVLLLDGLDELPDETTDGKNKKSSHRKFLEELSRIADVCDIFVSCRAEDYKTIVSEAAAVKFSHNFYSALASSSAVHQAFDFSRQGVTQSSGVHGVEFDRIVTLRPLSIDQMEAYLRDQKPLLKFVEEESTIYEWLRTPLLISFFAFLYETLDEKEQKEICNLHDAKVLRDKLFQHYVRERHRHESQRSERALVSLKDLISFLKSEALRSLNCLTKDGPRTNAESSALSWAIRLNIGNVGEQDGKSFVFVHQSLRDCFAYLAIADGLRNRSSFNPPGDMIRPVALLADDRFFGVVMSMTSSSFIRGEYGTDMAYALMVIASKSLQYRAAAVDQLKTHVQRFSRLSAEQLEVVHRLAQTGTVGQTALTECLVWAAENDRQIGNHIMSYCVGNFLDTEQEEAWFAARELWIVAHPGCGWKVKY